LASTGFVSESEAGTLDLIIAAYLQTPKMAVLAIAIAKISFPIPFKNRNGEKRLSLSPGII
jgi:hypothetical protein